MLKQPVEKGNTFFCHFASNDTSGSGDDGASAASAVRECGASASAAPAASPSPSLLSHASYPAGLYEIAVDTSSLTVNTEYAVFCTLAVDSQNPSGYVDSFKVIPASEGFGADLLSTTIASLSSQTVFTLSEGSGDDDAYNGCMLIATDATGRTQKCVGIIQDYAGGTKQVTLFSDPGIFTMADGDSIEIVAWVNPLKLAMTESYAGDTEIPTAEQSLFMLLQAAVEFSRSGTTITVKKRDQSTAAFTISLDAATPPITSATQAT